MNAEKKARGRQEKYKAEYDQVVKKLAGYGLTEKEIADFIGIAEKTIRNWKKRHTSFKKAIESGKYKADIKVIGSLYKRAIGFKTKEITEQLVEQEQQQPDGSKTKIQKLMVTKRVTKEIAPNVAAISIWLRNRRGQLFKDKPKDEGMSLADLLTNIQTVSDLINSPVENRTLEEVEGLEDE